MRVRYGRWFAWDVVDAAVDRTRSRTSTCPVSRCVERLFPIEWTDEQADLIVLAEVGYYLDQRDLERAVDYAIQRLTPGDILLTVHWRRLAPDYPLTGVRVHVRQHHGFTKWAGAAR